MRNERCKQNWTKIDASESAAGAAAAAAAASAAAIVFTAVFKAVATEAAEAATALQQQKHLCHFKFHYHHSLFIVIFSLIFATHGTTRKATLTLDAMLWIWKGALIFAFGSFSISSSLSFSFWPRVSCSVSTLHKHFFQRPFTIYSSKKTPILTKSCQNAFQKIPEVLFADAHVFD